MRGISVVGEEMAGSQRDEGMGDGGSERGRAGGRASCTRSGERMAWSER